MRAVLLALTLSLSPGSSAAAPSIIRIGVASIGTGGRPASGGSYGATAAALRALESEFEKDGVKVRYTYFSGAGPSVNESLANGQLDFAYQGDLPGLVARAGGLRTRVILATGRFGGLYVAVPPVSPAKSLEDLRGKRVAIYKGTTWQLAFWRLLASRGLRESDFRVISMSGYDGNAALLAGDIDAQVSGNDLFPLVDAGTARIVHSTRDDIELSRLGHLLVAEEFAARHPEVVQRVVNALLKVAAWETIEANRAQTYALWTRSGLGLSAWKAEFDGAPLGVRDSPLLDEFYRAQYKRLLRSARELKLVRGDFDVDAWIDGSFLERGLRELKVAGTWREFDASGKPKGGAAQDQAPPHRFR